MKYFDQYSSVSAVLEDMHLLPFYKQLVQGYAQFCIFCACKKDQKYRSGSPRIGMYCAELFAGAAEILSPFCQEKGSFAIKLRDYSKALQLSVAIESLLIEAEKLKDNSMYGERIARLNEADERLSELKKVKNHEAFQRVFDTLPLLENEVTKNLKEAVDANNLVANQTVPTSLWSIQKRPYNFNDSTFSPETVLERFSHDIEQNGTPALDLLSENSSDAHHNFSDTITTNDSEQIDSESEEGYTNEDGQKERMLPEQQHAQSVKLEESPEKTQSCVTDSSARPENANYETVQQTFTELVSTMKNAQRSVPQRIEEMFDLAMSSIATCEDNLESVLKTLDTEQKEEKQFNEQCQGKIEFHPSSELTCKYHQQHKDYSIQFLNLHSKLYKIFTRASELKNLCNLLGNNSMRTAPLFPTAPTATQHSGGLNGCMRRVAPSRMAAHHRA